MTEPAPIHLPEREELVAVLERQRGFLLTTVQGLTDEQARLTPTVSALGLGEGVVRRVPELARQQTLSALRGLPACEVLVAPKEHMEHPVSFGEEKLCSLSG